MGTKRPDTRCPRCGGKIIIDKDMHGWYEQCLQCSYSHDLVLLAADTKNPVHAAFRLEEAPVLSDAPLNTYH